MSKRSRNNLGPVMLPGAHRQVHKRANGAVVIYWYATRGGEQIGRFVGASADEAEAAELAGAPELAKAWGIAMSSRPAEGLFARVLADYMAHPNYLDLRKDTKRTYRVWLDRVKGEFGHLCEAEITPELVGEWRKGVYEKHGARAADHALRVFSRVCSFGRHPERRLFSKHFKPTEGFESLYRAPAQDAWPREDVNKIAQLPARVRDALSLAYNTGLRRADLIELPWTAIDEQAGVIRWVTSKGRRKARRIVIPLTMALRATLKRIPKRALTVLTSIHGTPWTSNGLAHAVNETLKAAGIPGRLHGLRRSAATNLAAQGLSSRQIARIMGWGEGDAEAMSAIYIDEEAV
jgi:integrase